MGERLHAYARAMSTRMKTIDCPDIGAVKLISVLVADDHAAIRKSLKIVLELDGDLQVVGEAKNGREAVQLALSLRPDVIVMDLAMPLLNGLQATRQIREALPMIRILIFSGHPDPEYIKQAIVSGASGYLVKQSSTQFLAEAVREVLKGNIYLETQIPKPLRDQCRKLFHRREVSIKKVVPVASVKRGRLTMRRPGKGGKPGTTSKTRP